MRLSRSRHLSGQSDEYTSGYGVKSLSYCGLHAISLADLMVVLDDYPEFADDFLRQFVVTFCIQRDVTSVSFYTVSHKTQICDSKYPNVTQSRLGKTWSFAENTMFIVHIIASKQHHWVTAVLETEIFYHRYMMIDNSSIRQYFQSKLCAYFTEYFRIMCTEFGQDSFRFHISVVHCVWFTFTGHSVYYRCAYSYDFCLTTADNVVQWVNEWSLGHIHC